MMQDAADSPEPGVGEIHEAIVERLDLQGSASGFFAFKKKKKKKK